MLRALGAALFISVSLTAGISSALADGPVGLDGRWLRVMTVDGEEPDPKNNAGCAAFLSSSIYDTSANAEANLTISGSRMETDEEGSDVTGEIRFTGRNGSRSDFVITAEHEAGTVERNGFIEQLDTDYIAITIVGVQIDSAGTKGDVVRRFCREM